MCEHELCNAPECCDVEICSLNLNYLTKDT